MTVAISTQMSANIVSLMSVNSEMAGVQDRLATGKKVNSVKDNPAIWAIGDMTFRPIPVHGGRRHRLESVPNALEQAKQAAAAITGRAAPTPEVPWFWSDQYELKLQIAGLPDGADRQVVRGDVEGGSFAVFHLAGDRIVCVEAVNAPAEFMAGRQMIGRGSVVDAARLADRAVSMKEVAAAPA